MTKLGFIALCQGKVYCTLCRAKEAGMQFREHIIKYLFEPLKVDFACPFGYEWDAKIEPEFKSEKFVLSEGNRRLTISEQNENAELSKQRFEICKTCDKASENGHKCSLYKGCCFGRWRAKAENKCPADPPKWDVKIVENKY